jgi:hypothetical protein
VTSKVHKINIPALPKVMHNIQEAASESASTESLLLVSPSSSTTKCNAGKIVASQSKPWKERAKLASAMMESKRRTRTLMR